ncbi:molybdopterin-dependent oxidoreductase [Arthrobacter sp. zg-Y916]|uniref:molybdopterin-dependent oxidoreductase n=1 Tax=Arthrobacter sp. zg-Y916 TaxID=2894190 RepID=UPI001E43B0C4|nr:molybdopterin-dependent oxidoreductase [Arthrobacter sp. zg-Y916]MCC9193944.1 molybdopterin-dependent oxidoreductase [Arthrobacter sp. zg-Y916]
MPRTWPWAGAAGLVAAALAVAAGELSAAVLSPALSPVTAVGAVVVDAVPGPVKDWAIAVFGTADKIALLAGMLLVIALIGMACGLLETRRPPWGSAVLAGFGVLGAAAALSRAQFSALALLPPLLAGLVGVLVLRTLAARIRSYAASGPGHPGASRRDVLAAVGGGAAVAAVGGGLAGLSRSSQVAAEDLRAGIDLPSPVEPALPVPAGADLSIPGTEPLITPNADFYRIDTALRVPLVNPREWRLRVTGLVEREVELTYDQLLAKPLQESWVTLACVSNEVGGSLIGNARWLGWPVRKLLAEAGVQAGADVVLSASEDGWTATTPLEALTDARDSLLAVGMNGEPLPPEHGFPVRMVVPGLYGYVSATKWVTELKVSRFADETAYWTDRGWSERGPVKLSSRIDTPSRNARLSAGTVTVAGVAWAQHTGISNVQVKVDDGEWQDARLAAGISADTWRQFAADVELSAGDHTVEVRAFDAAGNVQDATKRPVVPDGATGLHSVTVSAG